MAATAARPSLCPATHPKHAAHAKDVLLAHALQARVDPEVPGPALDHLLQLLLALGAEPGVTAVVLKALLGQGMAGGHVGTELQARSGGVVCEGSCWH